MESIKINPKYFFTYARKFSKIKDKVGPLIDENDVLTNNNIEMASILSKQFKSVFTPPSTETLNTDSTPINKLSDLKFIVNEIESAIDGLRSSSAPGPDGFPAILLKKCVTSIAIPLSIFWRKCVNESHIPECLKESIIAPLYKSGSKSCAANYRPVALTSHLIKVFEKIVKNHITEFLSDNNLLNPNQHGFRDGRSCLSELLDHYNEIINYLQFGTNVDVVYLDFAKAFDKVDHKTLLNKMQILGITGKMYDFVRDFLTNRKQSVIVNGVCSESVHVTSGVPPRKCPWPAIIHYSYRRYR